MSKKNTHQKQNEKKKGKKKTRERERERAKKPKITPKTLNHQIQMAPPKKNQKKHLRESGSHRHVPEIWSSEKHHPEKKRGEGSGVGSPRICYQLVVDWERITGFQLIGGMAAEEGNKS
jgi:hypothetical protein